MKLHKLISRTVVGAALLGATFGGAFSFFNTSVSANQDKIYDRVTGNIGDGSYTNPNPTTGIQSNIDNGLLSLDAVPNFNFGNNDSTNKGDNDTLKLINGRDIDTSDGNNNNLLEVTDYRQIHRNSTNDGWTLSAKLGNFTNTDSNTYDSSQINSGSNWRINLNNSNLSSDSSNVQYYHNNYDRYSSDNTDTIDNNTSNSAPKINDGATLNSDNSPSTVMGTNNSYYRGHGTTNINYNNSTTSLSTPYNVQPGKYSATIYWNLSASPDSSDDTANPS